jgi:hypothetical protein
MAVTSFCAHSRDDEHIEVRCSAMKAQTYCTDRDKALSELATLSCDPGLVFRPDPAFRVRFRNPDELIEGDFDGIDGGVLSAFTTPSHWAGAASWRRSPKD